MFWNEQSKWDPSRSAVKPAEQPGQAPATLSDDFATVPTSRLAAATLDSGTSLRLRPVRKDLGMVKPGKATELMHLSAYTLTDSEIRGGTG